MTEAIGAVNLSPIDNLNPTFGPSNGVGVNSSNELGNRFVDWLSNELAVVNNQVNTAELDLREFAAGKTDNLHHVMLSMNKASLSFELMVEVRNKVLEGYQEIMRMQI